MPLASQAVGPLLDLQATAVGCVPSIEHLVLGEGRQGSRKSPSVPCKPGSQAALCLWAVSENRGLRPAQEPLAA